MQAHLNLSMTSHNVYYVKLWKSVGNRFRFPNSLGANSSNAVFSPLMRFHKKLYH